MRAHPTVIRMLACLSRARAHASLLGLLALLMACGGKAVAGGSDEGDVAGAGNSAGGYGNGGEASGGRGNAGLAGSAGVEGEFLDYCRGKDDIAKISSSTYDAGIIKDVAYACAAGCSADLSTMDSCVSSCVETEAGLSKNCAGCYGAHVACMAQSCLQPCAVDTYSQSCVDCQCGQNTGGTNCAAKFLVCAGLAYHGCTP